MPTNGLDGSVVKHPELLGIGWREIASVSVQFFFQFFYVHYGKKLWLTMTKNTDMANKIVDINLFTTRHFSKHTFQ